MNLKKKLKSVTDVTKLKKYTIEEAFKILKLSAASGCSNGFLFYDDKEKASQLIKKLKKEGLVAVFDGDAIIVEWF